jgi:hypothetical protein
VSVWSLVGSGSTFTMRLPLAGRVEAAEAINPPPLPEPSLPDPPLPDRALPSSSLPDPPLPDPTGTVVR